MQKMRIWIRINEPELAMRLAKRLTELAPGIEVDTGKDGAGDYDFAINDSDQKAIFPVSEALDRMEGEYFRKTGKRLQRSNKGPKGLFIFTSSTGGSGLTSIALTFARHMAGKLNGRVLFVDVGDYGRVDYLEPIRDRDDRSRQLVYLIKAGLNYDVRDYLAKDRYGPEVIAVGDSEASTILTILEGSGCEYAVVAGRKMALNGTAGIEVVNTMDLRKSALDGEADVMVYNNGSTIPHNPESFINDGRTVRIDMSGDFAMAVRRLFKEVMDGYGYGRSQKDGA